MMTVQPLRHRAGAFPWTGVCAVLLVLIANLAAVHLARHFAFIGCGQARINICHFATDALVGAYGIAAGSVLLILFARDSMRDLLSHARVTGAALLRNVAAMAVLLASLPALRGEPSDLALAGLALLWLTVPIFIAVNGALMLASADRWRRFARVLGWHLPLVLGAALMAIWLAVQFRGVWDSGFVAEWTFDTVVWMLHLLGQNVEIDVAEKIIGAGDFYIKVYASCSGTEGLILVTVFSTIYLALFRRELQFPRAFLIVPVALFLSWLLNSVRIVVLLQIGLAGHPELAIGGFHSHAGWLMFTLLAIGIVLTTQATGVFRAATPHAAPVASAPPPPPFLRDPAVAMILPFGVFMASALLASTFSQTPALIYPLRAVAMVAALALVWRHVAALDWRFGRLAPVAGAAIAVYWIALSPPAAPDPATAGLGTLAFGVWLLARIVGTTLLVPVIEEMFFRGYLLTRIAPEGSGRGRAILGIAVTSALFAILHDRWIAALVAGVILAVLTLRHRRLSDAIVAHAVANGLIAAWAVSTNNWAVI